MGDYVAPEAGPETVPAPDDPFAPYTDPAALPAPPVDEFGPLQPITPLPDEVTG